MEPRNVPARLSSPSRERNEKINETNEINEEGKITKKLPAYPDVLKAYDYYKGKYSGRFRSYVVENVFSRRAYKQAGGFKNFDLAWGSDVATWCIFSNDKGMCSIPEALIGWRRSSQNITPNKSLQISERKLMAQCASLNWAYDFFQIESDIWTTNRRIFISVMRHYRPLVGKECFDQAFKTFYEVHGHYDKRLTIWILIHLPKLIYRLLLKFD